MFLSTIDAQPKLEKLAKATETFQFGISPEGFLLVSKGNVVEVANFKLFHGGKYYRRNGFKFSTNLSISPKGLFLCSFGKGKFMAECGEEGFEYSTAKKPLRSEFCTIILMHISDRIVLLVADGEFGNEAFLVTLADNRSNALFAAGIVRKLVGARDEDAANALLIEEEEDHGKEE